MVLPFITNLTRISYFLTLIFVPTLLLPSPVMPKSETQPCIDAQKQIKQTQNVLQPMEQDKQLLQQHVQTIYQELFACKTGGELSLAEQRKCLLLQEEGPKQFQAMVTAITVSHQMSQQLARQTQHIQFTCATRSK